MQAKYDDDGSGEIDAEELMGILKSLGLDVTEEEVHAMVHEVDEDGSGTIDFQEFKDYWEKNIDADGDANPTRQLLRNQIHLMTE